MDYGFYTSIYCGNQIAAEDWARLASRAEEWLEMAEALYSVTYYNSTTGRAKAACAIAECWQAFEAEDAAVSSVSVGSVSTSYASAGDPSVLLTRSCMKALRLYAEVYRGNYARP